MQNKQDQPVRKAYSLEETAKIFGKHRSWAYRQLRLGRLKVIRGFGAMLVPASEIERILNSGDPEAP
jgi:hypothetical protein